MLKLKAQKQKLKPKYKYFEGKRGAPNSYFPTSYCIFTTRWKNNRYKVKINSFVMIRPMMGRRAKPKKFDMPLRYYNPEEENRRRKRIQIKTRHRRKDGQGIRVLVYAVGLGIVIWIMTIL